MTTVQNPSRADVVAFFRNRAPNARFVDRLKIRYRPYICPFERLLHFIDRNAAVFDIGCGSGQFCLLASEFSDARRIHGIEIDSRLVANARAEVEGDPSRMARVTFSVYDGVNVPDMIHEFDVVFMIDVLHHIPADAQWSFLKNVHDRMKPGATLILKDIDASSPFVFFNKLHDMVFGGGCGHERAFATAQAFCASLGFAVEDASTQRVGVYPHYFLRLRKAASSA